MIEKFTEEELKIIMKEIKELPKDKKKRNWCEEEIKRLSHIYRNENISGAMHSYELSSLILTLIDNFMGNFEKASKNGKHYKGKYTRYVHIRKEIADEYRECFGEIVDVLEKHSKMFVEDNE